MVGPGRCLRDPKGPGRCLSTPWVAWVRAVPIGPLQVAEKAPRAPESAVLPSAAVVGTHPVRSCACAMRPALVPELPMAGPHAPRGPSRLGWAGAVAWAYRTPLKPRLLSGWPGLDEPGRVAVPLLGVIKQVSSGGQCRAERFGIGWIKVRGECHAVTIRALHQEKQNRAVALFNHRRQITEVLGAACGDTIGKLS